MAITHDNVEKLRVSWGSDNDGSGSGLDADKIDNLDSTDLYQIKYFSGDIDLVNTVGTYNPSGATNYPGAKSQFMLHVSKNGGFIHQHLINDSTQFQRRSTDGGGTWSAWVETLTSASTSGPYVLKAGDTMTGGLKIQKSSPNFYLKNTDGAYADHNFMLVNYHDGFGIQIRDDETFIANPFMINWNTHVSTFNDKLEVHAPTNTQYALDVVSNVDDPTQSYQFAQRIQQNTSGSTATGGDRVQGAMLIDVNSTTTGGDTSDEHRVYGALIDIDVSGDSDLIHGIECYVDANHSAGTISDTSAIVGHATANQNNSSAVCNSLVGVRGYAGTDNANSSAAFTFGGYFYTYTSNDGGDITTARGVYSEVQADNSNIGAAYGVDSVIDVNAGTIGNGYLFHGSYQGSTTGTDFGLYISGEERNYLSSSLSIGTSGSLGDNSIVMGDNDTGFMVPSDGVLNHYANSHLIFHTTPGGIFIDSGKIIVHNSTDSYDKIRVWNSSSYTIGMKAAQSYGALNDYATTFTMNDDNNRGWLWRKTTHSASEGAMSLSCGGVLTVPVVDVKTRSYNAHYDYGDQTAVAINFSLRNNFRINATGDLTLNNPTGLQNGQSGTIYVNRNSHNISFGSKWKKDIDSPAITGSSFVAISYYIFENNHIVYSLTRIN